ncbi:hypothetical protein [Nocardia noduli]|uniref:hypothetical protein n=1 Tax=Nocardia noduli TaxID=2815722 RepID=UPI001C210A7A|nr:hypothetical protein [Nocardia noduli]
MHGSPSAARELLCTTCLALHFDHDADIPATTHGAAHWVTILVLGLTRDCWRCTRPVICVSGLYPHYPAAEFRHLITTQDQSGALLSVAATLLDRIGRRDITATIGRVYSRTLQAWTIAVTCPHCGALQGNFPVGEETMDRVLAAGITGLDVLGHVPCPTQEWQTIVYYPSFGSLGL